MHEWPQVKDSRTVSKRRSLYSFFALILVLDMLSLRAAPIDVVAGSYTTAASPNLTHVLPTWWDTSLSSQSGVADASQTWLPPERPRATLRGRPFANPGITDLRIEDLSGTQIFTKELTAGTSFVFYAHGYDIGIPAEYQTATWAFRRTLARFAHGRRVHHF